MLRLKEWLALCVETTRLGTLALSNVDDKDSLCLYIHTIRQSVPSPVMPLAPEHLSRQYNDILMTKAQRGSNDIT
jgi:hypothetical protein